MVLLAPADALLDVVRSNIDRQTFHEGLEEIWKVIRAANGYIDRQAPWALNKTDKVRMGAVLRVLVDTHPRRRDTAAAGDARQHGADAGPARRAAPRPAAFAALAAPLTDGHGPATSAGRVSPLRGAAA